MKTIPLTQGQVALIDDADYDELIKTRWCAQWSPGTQSYYAIRTERLPNGKRRAVPMHRQVMGVQDSERAVQVDHVNHDTLDNRRTNLRIVTCRQNLQNLKAKSKRSSEYTGVSWHARSRKWQAAIQLDGKNKHLGYFADEEDAAIAYIVAYHNECKRLRELDESRSTC